MNRGPVTEQDLGLIDEEARLNSVVQFRIETFFFVAQRLLDETTLVLDAFFPRGKTTLGRHRSLDKNLTPWLNERQLVEPPNLRRLIKEVTTRVKDFRDDHIAHARSVDDVRKAPGLLWATSGELQLRLSWMAQRSNAEVGAESERLSDLLALLEKYVVSVLTFLSGTLVARPATQ